MGKDLGANSGSREPSPGVLGPSGFDPGRKRKHKSLEETYGLTDRDLPGGIFDDREDH